MYLTAADATERIQKYNLEADLTDPFVMMASDQLDYLMGGFVGAKYDHLQHPAFPRNVTLPGDTEGVVPERVLDWVALTAYELFEDHEPHVKSERVKNISEVFVRGRHSQPSRFKKTLLRPYRVRSVKTV